MSNTSNGPKSSPMLKAAELWSKTSGKGGQYLTGRLGGVKVLILENRDRQSDDEPSHSLFFVEAPDRRQGAGERPQERSGGQEPQTSQRASQPHRSGFAGHRVPDHQAPLDRDMPEAPEWA